ncbi:MAG: thiamine pyrophosphate-dependent dehydrogenase E1 component subunit alpha [Bacillota bacterium]
MDLEKAYELFEKLVAIRLAEEAIVKEYPSQEIRTPVHLYIGQEAVAAGVSICLNDNDFVVSNHRSHGHCLSKGMDLAAFFKELYGKQGGVSGGWGGSMHLCDMNRGIVGTSAIVAGGIPIAAGTALKQKMDRNRGVTVVYFGDGAVDEGVFWETLNFAALRKLPMLFVMEDNGFACQTAWGDRHAYDDIKPIICGFKIPVYEVDGNDPVMVMEVSDTVLKGIRNGQGPAFIICKTFRWMAHVGPNDDTSTGYRSPEEVDYWKKRCPVERMATYLNEIDPEFAPSRVEVIKAQWAAAVASSVASAKEAPYAVD